MDDVSPQVKIQIVKADLQMWRNTRWQLEMRHRVNKRIGNEQAQKAIETDLAQAEGAIAELEAILKEVQKEAVWNNESATG